MILNPQAGRGRGLRQEGPLRRAFQQAEVPIQLLKTEAAGHASELAYQARQDGLPVVVAAGGDGTISEVVNGLARATPADRIVRTLAILPLGSGNDFATALGYSGSLAAAIQTIATGRVRRVDLGRQAWREGKTESQRYFNNSLGIGWEAQICRDSERIPVLRGIARYSFAALRALHCQSRAWVSVGWQETTGEYRTIQKPTFMLSIGNSDRSGGGFRITPKAVLDDGYFDLAIGEVMSGWRLFLLLPKAIAGTHIQDPAVTTLKFRQAEILCHEPLPVHADGEFLADRVVQLQIDVQPQRLEILA